MATTDFDRTHKLNSSTSSSKMKSIDYDVYFGEMWLSEEQKENRIELAEKLEDEILLVLSLIAVMSESNALDWNYIEERFRNAYMNVLGDENGNVDSYTANYISEMSRSLTESSERNLGDDYIISYDRARYISENDANAILNYGENEEAILAGYTMKTWHTMEDNRVRASHAEIDGETIPITEPFLVGDSLMDYPGDISYGADAKEYVGCRCSIEYS